MPTAPGGIRAAAALSILGALALVATAIVDIVRTRDFEMSAFVTAGFYLLVTVILILVARKLREGSGTARSIVITWSLILVLAMITLIQILGWVSYVGIALGVATLIVLALPSSRAFIRPRELFQD